MGAVTAVVLFSIVALALADPIRFASPIHLTKSANPSDIPSGRNIHHVNTPVDAETLARYNPQQSNQYHLFTRRNPTVSQPLLINNEAIFRNSNFDKRRRTIILIHGQDGNATSNFVQTMVPAIFASMELNVIVVDWTEGTELGVPGVVASANSLAQFIRWMMEVIRSNEDDYSDEEDFHLIGLGVGAQYAAIASRSARRLGHITALDPPTWQDEAERLRPNDAMYTEVVFTTSQGVVPNERYAHVDFYPNGGRNMPGCGGDWACSHARAYFYMAESIVSGGFTGRECASNEHAMVGDCSFLGGMQMAAQHTHAYQARGVYYLQTNAASPFSQG